MNIFAMHEKRLYDFLTGTRTNYHGVDIQEIWSFSDKQLEANHNYIQWIFPLTEPSLYNPLAPVVKDISLYDNQKKTRDNMIMSLVIMCKFYGLEVCSDKKGVTKIVRSGDFTDKAKKWLTIENHNFLRITRILSSLKLFGLEKEAKLFFTALQDIYNEYKDVIGEESFAYWKNAIEE